VNFETLSFVGDALVNGSGDHALVWDLNAVGRATTQYLAPIPEGCNACNGQLMRLNDSGTALAMTDQNGNSTVAVDLTDGHAVTVSTFFDEGAQYSGASWFDDSRLIVYSPGDNALLVLSGTDYATVDLSIPFTLADNATALSIRADGPDGTVSVLDTSGGTWTVDVKSGRVLASSTAFAPLFDGPSPAGFDISPDQATAYMWQYGGPALYVELATGATIYSATDIDGMAYDAASRLHVFDDAAESTIDPATGKPGTKRPAEIDTFRQVAISPNGDLVVEGGSTGLVTFLDLEARGAVLGRVPVPVQDQKQTVPAFTRDGTKVVMSLQEMSLSHSPGAVRVIDMTLASWMHNSCAVAGRDLTPEEWEIYVGTTPPADLRCDR
jgi:hypothetical protein